MTEGLSRMFVLTLLTLAGVGMSAEAWAQTTPPAAEAERSGGDRDANYYYPPPQTREVYRSTATTLADSTRERRLGFVTGMTREMLDYHYAPQFIMFAKGDEANRLIIVAISDSAYNTLYRARALFAMLTAIARLTPYFKENSVSAVYNFFDLCKLLGFTQLTWSDGKTLAHQIQIK